MNHHKSLCNSQASCKSNCNLEGSLKFCQSSLELLYTRLAKMLFHVTIKTLSSVFWYCQLGDWKGVWLRNRCSANSRTSPSWFNSWKLGQLNKNTKATTEMFRFQTYSPCGDGLTKSRTATFLPKLAAETQNTNTINILKRKAISILRYQT